VQSPASTPGAQIALGQAISVPSVFWFFGGHSAETLAADGPVPQNHSPHFAPVIEPTLTTGVRTALAAILSRLGNEGGRQRS
jgi:hippurate hydrolase